nr:MAG TPA: hypothetical protein [Crassvirales sp.]
MKEDNNFENLMILYLMSVIGIFTSLAILVHCGILK